MSDSARKFVRNENFRTYEIEDQRVSDRRRTPTPSHSPSEGLTEEERQLLVGALNSAEQLMLNGDEYSRGRARDLVIGVRRKLDRLVKEGK